MSDLCLSLRVIQKSVHTPACPVILSMSVEEVERVLLYSLEASVSPEERKRQEVIFIVYNSFLNTFDIF